MDNKGISKIGYSENPTRRLDELKSKIGSEFRIMHAIPFASETEARSFERITQSMLDEYTVRLVDGEWVKPPKTYWYDEYFKAPTYALENAMML